MDNDTEKAINDLEAALQAGSEDLNVPTVEFKLDDIYDQYSHLFKGKVGKDFNAMKATNLVTQINKPSKGILNNIKYFLGYKLNISKFRNTLGVFPYPVQFEVDQYYTTRFIGATISNLSDELDAVNKILVELKFLSDNGYLKGNLATLIRVPFYNSKWAIVSYPLLNEAGNEYLKNKANPIYMQEGETPTELGDL